MVLQNILENLRIPLLDAPNFKTSRENRCIVAEFLIQR